MFAKTAFAHFRRNAATSFGMLSGAGMSGYRGASRFVRRSLTSRYVKGAVAGAAIGGMAAVGEDFVGGNRIGIRRGIAMGAFGGLGLTAGKGLWSRGFRAAGVGTAGITGYSLYRGFGDTGPNTNAGR